MSRRKQLPNKRQCEKCPWKKSVNPFSIPDGYSEAAHRKLKSTIIEGMSNLSCVRAMACHESPVGAESYCIGWLFHQLGPGNNIGLRFRMLEYDLSDVELVGEQHNTFEDTLPGSAT